MPFSMYQGQRNFMKDLYEGTCVYVLKRGSNFSKKKFLIIPVTVMQNYLTMKIHFRYISLYIIVQNVAKYIFAILTPLLFYLLVL
jgi:hypothetical protein